MSIDKKAHFTAPLESRAKRAAFIYSPLLQKSQWVNHYLFHISDVLPTLLSAANISLSRGEFRTLKFSLINKFDSVLRRVPGA